MKYLDNVRIKKDVITSRISKNMQDIQKLGISGIIHTIITPVYLENLNNFINVSFLNGNQSYCLKFNELELVELTDEQQKINEEGLLKIYPHYKSLINKLDTPIKGCFLDIDPFKKTDLNIYLQTRFVHVKQCKIDFQTKKITNGGYIRYKQDCCDFIKSNFDFCYYFPEVYLNFYGYTQYDLHKWLRFIKDLDIGFEYIFEGPTTLPSSFDALMKSNFLMGKNYNIIGSAINFGKKAKFFEIYVTNGGHSWMAYMYLLLIRYMHQETNWHIPALAMQIKHELKEKITNWEALLLAHYSPCYLPTNSLINSNNSTLVDIFASKTEIITKIKQNKKMMRSFDYFGGNYRNDEYSKCQNFANKHRNKLQTLMQERKFEECFNELKNLKNGNNTEK